MRNKKTIIFFTFVCWFVLFVFIGLYIFLNSIDKQTTKNTTEYIATVEKVLVTNTRQNVYIEIYTQEYNTSLYISTNISKKINIKNFSFLKKGERIFFRVSNDISEDFNELEFCNIISLKTSDKEFFSLENYNEYMRLSAFPARIVCIVISTIMLIVSVFSSLQLRKKYPI